MSPGKAQPSQPIESYYWAQPQSGAGKGVLVLHAWWGLTPFFKEFCDRLTTKGLVVLAPDLYHGATASTIQEAYKLRSKLKRATVAKEITEAAEHLCLSCGMSRQGIGLVGFSLGGHWALWLAEQTTVRVAATVIFYATRTGDYAASSSAFQFHLAETDDFVAASGVKKLQKGLKAAGKEAEFYTYPGTTHWFFESDRAGAYNPQAADLAWNRAVGFLKKHT